jgi:hypothetical protein
VDVKEMLAVHERGADAQLVVEERLLYIRGVLRGIEDALRAPERSVTFGCPASYPWAARHVIYALM